MWRILPAAVILLMLVVGCTAADQQAPSTQLIPTLFPTPLPDGVDLEAAQRVAILFLSAWEAGDLQSMHQLLSFSSQEAYPLERFTAQYQAAQTEMTFQSVTYSPNTLYRETPVVIIFNYDATFATEVLGEFTDPNRNLRLVLDERSQEWRVAWTPGDIFPELQGGNILRLERFSLRRANIYDRDGNILADQLGTVAAVSVIKQDIPDYEACVPLLAQTTGRPLEVVQAILNEAAPNWLSEMGTIEPGVYDQYHQQLEANCAAQFRQRFTRRYVNGSLAPHVIGYVGYPTPEELPALKIAGFNQDSILGRAGIERSWDEALRGQPGGRLIIVNPDGQLIREIARQESRQSQSVWLTLDSDLQQYTLQVIGEAYLAAADSWARTSKGAAAVVIDLRTGEILALVSYPTYDANALNPFPAIGREIAEAMKTEINEDPRVPLLNRAAQSKYPAGSIFKTVDAIAVADSGVYPVDQKFNCATSWQREPNFVRYDWSTVPQGVLTLAQALTRSCNPYFYEVGYQMNLVDPYLLPSYARKLGFGAVTGLGDLPESPGTIPDPDWVAENGENGLPWSMSDAINMAIGQGYVEVTPLQIVRLFALVGNGGDLVRPQLVRQVGIIGEAPSYTMTPEISSHVTIKPEVLATVREGLCAVTTAQYGTASHIFRRSPLQEIGVCGKTGTAQATGDVPPHAWFAAYAPRENPEIAIAVIVENSNDGSAIAAPIVCRVLEHYFFGTKNPCP